MFLSLQNIIGQVTYLSGEWSYGSDKIKMETKYYVNLEK